MIPNFYSMGRAHPTGELPCKGYGPATPDSSCQTTLPHSYQVKSMTSFSGTNLQQSTPSSYQQLPFYNFFNPPPPILTNFNHVNFGPLPASSADPPRFSSSHEFPWNTVAHWETNGTAISSTVCPEVKPKLSPAATYALLKEMVTDIKASEEKAALAMQPTPLCPTAVPESSESAPLPSPTSDLNQTVPDQWQIAPESSSTPSTILKLMIPSPCLRLSIVIVLHYSPLSLILPFYFRHRLLKSQQSKSPSQQRLFQRQLNQTSLMSRI